MTPEEIKTLIDQKIAGQGSMVDVGGALPKILSEILDAAFAGANVQSDILEMSAESVAYIQGIKNVENITTPTEITSDDAQAFRRAAFVRYIIRGGVSSILALHYLNSAEQSALCTYITDGYDTAADDIECFFGKIIYSGANVDGYEGAVIFRSGPKEYYLYLEY